MQEQDSITQLLTRRVAEVIVREDLRKQLLADKKLRVKFGIDPTSPLLHLGHMVPLLKLREFQDLGHQIVLIIGDFTAQIGDPSGRATARKKLSRAQIQKNMRTYEQQAGKILNLDQVEIRCNSEWLSSMDVMGSVELMSKATVAQVMRRREFKMRLAVGDEITYLEMLYPILQAYDSVAVHADVEIGGLDQKFNLLMGRQIQKRYNQTPQNVLLTPLLIGTDGQKKMSKSEGNSIALTEKPSILFTKIMQIPDAQILTYFKLCTNVSQKEITEFPDLVSLEKITPLDLKKRLAKEIVQLYYGDKAALKSQSHFEKTVQKRETPEKIEAVRIEGGEWRVEDLLVKLRLASSKSEAKRLVEQGGVEIDKSRIKDQGSKVTIREGTLVKVGKKRYVKIKI